MTTQKKMLIALHEKDNVLIAMGAVGPGQVTLADGQVITLPTPVTLGHKVAARSIEAGELVQKYGMPIGVATSNIAVGEHVHVHNIASRYTATHFREDEAGFGDE